MTDIDVIGQIVDDFMKGNDVLLIGKNRHFVTDAQEIIFRYLHDNFTDVELKSTLEEIRTQNELGE